MKSYVTVLSTEDYLEGVIVLAESLKSTNTKYPITVLITNNISIEIEELLKSYNINVIRKNKIDIPLSIKNKNDQGIFSHWTNTFDKLQIFELTQFDKIVYLDSDMYIRRNIDELFNKKNMTATLDRPNGPGSEDEGVKRLTSGLMVIEPRNGMVQEFINIIAKIEDKRESVGDQDILQEYDRKWDEKKELHLDVRYNMFFSHINYYTNLAEYSIDDIYVAHFIFNKKPFHFRLDEIPQYIEFIKERKEATYKNNKVRLPKEYIEYSKEEEQILQEYFDIIKKVRIFIKEENYER